MPAIGSVLFNLIKGNIHDGMKGLSGTGPLEVLKDPSYFLEMCSAIGKGIAEGSPVISFITADVGLMGTPPIPAIIGQGFGIKVNEIYMTEKIYTMIRDKIVSAFGSTSHDPWPPTIGNSGQYLKAVAHGIAKSVTEHYKGPTWTLISAHPTIYAGGGEVLHGNFSGLDAGTVKSLILSYSPKLKGPFWPMMAQAIAEGYVDGIHNKSLGTVVITGVCVPTPIPPQICGIPSTGSGSGTAT